MGSGTAYMRAGDSDGLQCRWNGGSVEVKEKRRRGEEKCANGNQRRKAIIRWEGEIWANFLT